LRILIKEAAPYRGAPERLVHEIRSRVPTSTTAAAPASQARGAWWSWLRPAALVAVTATITAVITWLAAPALKEPSGAEMLAEQVISAHARAAVTGHIADIASSERHAVKPWLSSKLDFSPPVPDLSSEGFPLAGGRLDYLGQRPVAVLVYKRRKHVIDVFVSPENESRAVPSLPALSKRGYQVVHWTQGGLAFWAISDLNSAELKTFSEKYAGK
jgi:anti-sigma factor RsiW